MNKKEKFGVLVAMSMGVFAGVISIVKALELPAIANEKNFTFASTNLVILGIAESAITIMAASIPILRALLREHRGGIRPPPPAEFYNLDSLENNQHTRHADGEGGIMYAGTQGTKGTGKSSTTVTSGRTRSRTRSGRSSNSNSNSKGGRSLFGSLKGSSSTATRSSSGGSKDEEAGNGHAPVVHVHHLHVVDSIGNGGCNGRPVMMRRLSRLSSALSVGTAGESDPAHHHHHHHDHHHQRNVSWEESHTGIDPPPPGKIVKEREVTIEYDQRPPSPDTHHRLSEWPTYPSQGSDSDLAHVPAMRPWGDDDDDDDEIKGSQGRR